MTAAQAWDEIAALGRLAATPRRREVAWAVIECPGGDDCRCRFADRGRNWRHYRNDRLAAMRVFGWYVPPGLLPVARAWDAIVACAWRRPRMRFLEAWARRRDETS